MTTKEQAIAKASEMKLKKIIRMPRVREMTGLGTTAIYDRIKEGAFAKKINLGGRAIGFLESDVQNWISERVEASQAGC